MGLELIKILFFKVLFFVIIKWNLRTNCLEIRGVSFKGFWGIFWLMYGFFLSLFFYSFLVLFGDFLKGRFICFLKLEIFFFCDI